jgi:hypothetical protein
LYLYNASSADVQIRPERENGKERVWQRERAVDRGIFLSLFLPLTPSVSHCPADKQMSLQFCHCGFGARCWLTVSPLPSVVPSRSALTYCPILTVHCTLCHWRLFLRGTIRSHVSQHNLPLDFIKSRRQIIFKSSPWGFVGNVTYSLYYQKRFNT